jgi:hypothetical protein
MPFDSRFVFVAAMDIDPEKEDLFNEIYDSEHIPNLLDVDGVISVSRSKRVPANLTIGGETVVVGADEPMFIAYYELENPDVINSDAWAAAVVKDRWTD